MVPLLSPIQFAREDVVIIYASRTFKDPTNFNIINSDKAT
tara:strand:+ start:336 stop:455 length:120 start_codon:yes stop_codon:yes gene_type:complete